MTFQNFTFDIDADGIVNVGAKDKATNKEQSIRIQASGGLSDADIQKMIKEAEANKKDDDKRRQVIEARNHADASIHAAEKSLAEHGDKVSPGDKTAIETALADLKDVKDSDDVEAINLKSQNLIALSMKLGEAVYGEQNGQAAQDGAVDAEFEEA